MSMLMTVEVNIPAAVSDEVLVARLRQGQAEAGEELVRRHCQPLQRYLQRLVSSDQLAEDLFQQTWLSVLDHLDRFDPAGAGFKAWIYRIATNKANDHWRSRVREKNFREQRQLMPAEPAADASMPSDDAEQAVKLRAAIDRLPENQKQVLLMRYYSGLKFTDIAEALGCPLNTALGRMHKAMHKLRELMEA
jgi:RNA polymerase sigma-70 factor (ECF subfamily)